VWELVEVLEKPMKNGQNVILRPHGLPGSVREVPSQFFVAFSRFFGGCWLDHLRKTGEGGQTLGSKSV
jgi:hypothetical protein